MKIVVNCISELSSAVNELMFFTNNTNIFCFYGEVGVGKTTFIKEICKHRGVEEMVNSPTFSLVNEYSSGDQDMIYHFDFYRLRNLEEALDIGCEEYFDTNYLCLIEWPEKIEKIIPNNALHILMKKNNKQRIIEIYNHEKR